MDWLVYAGVPVFLAWTYLALFHWRFWRADQFLPAAKSKVSKWPFVVAVIPARNEADIIAKTLKSVAAQDYPGKFQVILVNDSSTDGTGKIAQSITTKSIKGDITVINAPPLGSGWAGKLWALNTGVAKAPWDVDFFWFTDADVEHDKNVLKGLVEAALQNRCNLVSQMVRLHCESFHERALVPAFIFFFQMLYPFRAANSENSRRAAAAGGCVLIEKAWLSKIGGLHSIKDALIDDCMLAKAVKDGGGRIWLGLGLNSRSVRPYSFGDFWMTVVRTAFTQLRLSGALLVGAVFGMTLIFLGPLILVGWGLLENEIQLWLPGILAWLLMVILYRPSLKIYQLSPVWGLFLPGIAFLYQLMTIHSAIHHWFGRGGQWKGRSYDFGEKSR